MAEGEFALVRQHLEAALMRTSDWVGDHDLYAMLADAAAREGDLPSLRRYAPLAEQSAAGCDHRLYRAIADRAQGVAYRMAGEYGQAGERLNRALESFSEIGARWQVGRTYVELAELARARHDRTTATEHLDHAQVEFEALQAAPDLVRARAALAELG
jgi:tetratricopeptide (TPR) repeat protein